MQFRTRQDRFPKNGAGERRDLQVCTLQVLLAQVSTGEVSAAHSCTLEVGLSEFLGAQVAAIQEERNVTLEVTVLRPMT